MVLKGLYTRTGIPKHAQKQTQIEQVTDQHMTLRGKDTRVDLQPPPPSPPLPKKHRSQIKSMTLKGKYTRPVMQTTHTKRPQRGSAVCEWGISLSYLITVC